jgi:light-regulated signal transduction histidine kinase (bacteriophytochrome)
MPTLSGGWSKELHSWRLSTRSWRRFSYSVSHDLRGPFRAVDGFSKAVLEDFGRQMPEEGHRYLQAIRQGAQRMGALIDDLLEFAHLNRQSLNKRAVNIGALVRDVLEELGSECEGRQIEIHSDNLPGCAGDPELLKQVWMNLLSNAVKYTHKCERAVVEIGCVKKAFGAPASESRANRKGRAFCSRQAADPRSYTTFPLSWHRVRWRARCERRR